MGAVAVPLNSLWKAAEYEYELPVAAARYDTFGVDVASEDAVYDDVDVDVDYAMANASAPPAVVLSGDTTYDLADGAAIEPAITGATYELADGVAIESAIADATYELADGDYVRTDPKL